MKKKNSQNVWVQLYLPTLDSRSGIDLAAMPESKLLDLYLVCEKLSYKSIQDDIIEEMFRRLEFGQLHIFDHSPTPISCNVPKLFYYWPFRLIWRQKRKGRGGRHEIV